MQTIKDTLLTLARAYGATGRESNIASVIRGMIEPYVDEIATDALGNLIATRKGAGKKIMVAAHMDHIGFIVTHIDKKGFLRVHNVGGINRANSLNRRVVFANGVNGVLSHEVEDFSPANSPMSKLFIDIGARSREEAEAMVDVGDVAVYAPDVFEMGRRVSGPAMDNRAGCALLVEALKALESRENTVVAVFTTQEEVGLRGAQTAAFALEPDLAIAVDVTDTGDLPEHKYPMDCHLGKGPAVKVMDHSVLCTPKVRSALEEAGLMAAVPVQKDILQFGGTDTAALQRSRSGVPAGAISIPTRYIHSPSEMCAVRDVEQAAALLAQALLHTL